MAGVEFFLSFNKPGVSLLLALSGLKDMAPVFLESQSFSRLCKLGPPCLMIWAPKSVKLLSSFSAFTRVCGHVTDTECPSCAVGSGLDRVDGSLIPFDFQAPLASL